MITDAGEQTLIPGTAAGFPAGKSDGHHLVNRSDKPAVFIEIGTRAKQVEGEYSDIDMKYVTTNGATQFLHKNGERY